MRLRPKQTPFRLTLGERGEMIAWGHLREKGYTLLEKNYRCALGEMDVIARKNGRLVFVEIKTRSSDRFGLPEEAVHSVKQKKLLKLAQWYLKEKKATEKPVAFAVLGILWEEGKEPEIRLIEQAFSADSEK